MESYRPTAVDAETALRLMVEHPPHRSLSAFHRALLGSIRADDDRRPFAERLRRWLLDEAPVHRPSGRLSPKAVPWALEAAVAGELAVRTLPELEEALRVVDEAIATRDEPGIARLRRLLADGVALHALVGVPADVRLCLALGRVMLDRPATCRALYAEWRAAAGRDPAALGALAGRLAGAGERWDALRWHLLELVDLVARDDRPTGPP